MVTQIYIQSVFYAVVALICLSPLLCLFACVYAIFCKDKEKQAKEPPTRPATLEILKNVDGGNCAICFQDIALNQEVSVLPCSDKHVFHTKCIKGWILIKHTCPICRYDLSEWFYALFNLIGWMERTDQLGVWNLTIRNTFLFHFSYVF